VRDRILHIIGIIFFTFLCQKVFGLPWWTIYLIPFLTCYLFEKREGHAFLIGFISIFIFWGAIAFFTDKGNESLLSSKLSGLFGSIGSFGLIALTAFTGGLIAAIGGWTGTLFKKIVFKAD
jgi:hypothetical protein